MKHLTMTARKTALQTNFVDLHEGSKEVLTFDEHRLGEWRLMSVLDHMYPAPDSTQYKYAVRFGYTSHQPDRRGPVRMLSGVPGCEIKVRNEHLSTLTKNEYEEPVIDDIVIGLIRKSGVMINGKWVQEHLADYVRDTRTYVEDLLKAAERNGVILEVKNNEWQIEDPQQIFGNIVIKIDSVYVFQPHAIEVEVR